MAEMNLGEPISFYRGAIILRFDKDAHIYYRMNGETPEAVRGVTNISNILDHSMYLMPWAVKMMYLKLLKTVPRVRTEESGDAAAGLEPLSEDYTRPIPWAEFDKLLQEAKSAHREHFEDAGDVGHLAHKWIEDSVRWAIAFNDGIVENMNEVAPTDERAINCGLAAHKWMVAHNVRWLQTEKKVYSRQHNYAGTMDGLALVDDCGDPACCPTFFQDQLSLIDWKSSNHLRIEYLYQTAAYQHAEQEEFGKPIAARWILRLGKEDGKFEAWYETNFEQDFEAFLACLALQRVNKAVEKRMSDAKKLRTFKKREEKKKSKPAPFKKRQTGEPV